MYLYTQAAHLERGVRRSLVFDVRCLPGAPKGVDFNSVKEVLLSVKAVKSMHALHLWALTLGQVLVSVHVAIGNGTWPRLLPT